MMLEKKGFILYTCYFIKLCALPKLLLMINVMLWRIHLCYSNIYMDDLAPNTHYTAFLKWLFIFGL